MAVPVLTTSPSTRTIIGTFENDSAQDVFQVLGKGGSIECGMNASGVIYNTVNGALVSVAPVIQVATVTSAQLLSLTTTPAILISSPGPGRLIFPQAIAFEYIAGTVPYTVTGNDMQMYIGWSGTEPLTTNNNLATVPDATFVDQSTSQIFISSGYSASSTPVSQAVNQSLVLGIVDTLTLGNGSLAISISYSIISIL